MFFSATKRRNTVRIGGTATVGLALVVLPVAAASAHVTVSSSNAAQGGYSTLNFKVPNEIDSASTIKVEVDFPAESPIASASYQPVAGWQTTITKDTPAQALQVDGQSVNEAVKSVVWTAGKGTGISKGQFQVFPLSVGPLPNVNSLSFTAIQTYSDGTVVTWNQTQTPGGAEPEHPAPTLTLTPASSTDHASSTSTESSTTTSSSNGLGIAALIVAIVALLVGLAALIAGRKKPVA